MSRIAYQHFVENLIIFFYDVKLLVDLPNYCINLLKDANFFRIVISLLFSVEYKKDKASVFSFHKAIEILYKCLKNLLKTT